LNSTEVPIKLTFLVRSLDYGGAQRQLVTLAKALDKNRFDVTVLSFYSGQPLEMELTDSAVQFVSLDKRGRWDVFGFSRRLLHELRSARPDIVHGYLDIPNLLALLSKPFIHARVVWGIRASKIDLSHYDWLSWLASRLERAFARFADLIIVNSQAALDHHLAKGFPRRKMIVIPNGIDTEAFKPDCTAGAKVRTEWGVPAEVKLIGVVGRIDPMKDLPVFSKAAAIVARERNDVRFACIGPGPASYVRELKELANDLGLADKVIWTGARADITAVYNALNIVCSSSCGESFPNAIGEAMACGIPCVVTDVGDSALLVGDCGFVVPPRSPEGLADGIIRCLDADRAELGRESRIRIVEEFSVQQLAQRTEAALLSII
jgi:glycosyltransferase involved in cell wall biosynthesis